MKNSVVMIALISLMNCAKDGKEIAETWQVEALANLLEPITNNAVAEGFIDGEPYVFSFAGLDSTKEYTGIHLRSYKYDLTKNRWQRIADLPDTLGKIASAASRVKDTIYIIGGYHVFEDHSERSSNKVHRYAIRNNRFLKDGATIPVPIDDQVQAVWRDSLIYVVTGWSDTANMPNVQIYNPSLDSWTQGTAIPNDHLYKSFGASGTIIGDTIFYYGGASMGEHYPIQNVLRKGIINAKNPVQIAWTHSVFDSVLAGYRMAATTVGNTPHWIGGSTITYNYKPIAYNGSGGVSPSNRVLYFKNGQPKTDFSKKFPMDLRGIAELNDSTKVIVGGISENQKVSNQVYLLKWTKE